MPTLHHVVITGTLTYEEDDMALWTPERLGSALRAFWLGDDLPGADGSAVAAWTDRTANAYVMAQGTAGSRPTLQTNELNGHRAVRFDGTDDFLEIASTLGVETQPFGIFGVWLMADAAKQALLQSSATGDTGHSIAAGGALAMNAGSEFSTAIAKARWCMTSALFNGASSALVIDGGAPVTGNPGTGTFTTGTESVKMGRAGAVADYYLNGDVAAVLVSLGLWSDADLARLYGWAAHTFGLTASLPADHAYKGFPPRGTGATPLEAPLGSGLRQRVLG